MAERTPPEGAGWGFDGDEMLDSEIETR